MFILKADSELCDLIWASKANRCMQRTSQWHNVHAYRIKDDILSRCIIDGGKVQLRFSRIVVASAAISPGESEIVID
uniref:MSP domain-containing protein n=1 Tax=Panagrellus redivivus TaxID=6233 RepID=A0A7E4ZQI4_PANRE